HPGRLGTLDDVVRHDDADDATGELAVERHHTGTREAFLDPGSCAAHLVQQAPLALAVAGARQLCVDGDAVLLDPRKAVRAHPAAGHRGQPELRAPVAGRGLVEFEQGHVSASRAVAVHPGTRCDPCGGPPLRAAHDASDTYGRAGSAWRRSGLLDDVRAGEY